MASEADRRFMRMALDACRRGVDAGQTPFGACIVNRAGEVVACTHNRVWARTDPCAHAEVETIREACGKVGQIQLKGCTIYSTTEPCPMCFGAIHWTGIERIVYGATVRDAAGYGFNELPISNAQMKEVGASKVELVPNLMRDEALELFRYWKEKKGKTY
jgi:tRNA(Arg) A34 adenosine deaminase TadA